MTRPVLLDNTVLTNFALVSRADLVMNLWPEAACTTSSVLAEYDAGVASGLLLADVWAALPILTLNQVEADFAATLSSRLGAGERTCISVAYHRHGLFVSDDQDARGVARHLSVPVTGTLGVLVACVRRDYVHIDRANALLKAMIAAGYRSPVVSLNPLLDE